VDSNEPHTLVCLKRLVTFCNVVSPAQLVFGFVPVAAVVLNEVRWPNKWFAVDTAVLNSDLI
jgi:hypothetical protein